MIINTFLEILMVCGGIVTLIGAIMGICEWWILRKIAELPIEAFPIKKTTYCQLVIDWCHQNISHKNTKKPFVSLNYYPHKRWNGFFFIKKSWVCNLCEQSSKCVECNKYRNSRIRSFSS
jgi:hypothetical protein